MRNAKKHGQDSLGFLVKVGTLIRALVVVLGLSAVTPHALAQGLDAASVAVLPAPRIAFSEQEMALARAVAREPGLADFYGSNGLRPIFLGADGARRRAALL